MTLWNGAIKRARSQVCSKDGAEICKVLEIVHDQREMFYFRNYRFFFFSRHWNPFLPSDRALMILSVFFPWVSRETLVADAFSSQSSASCGFQELFKTLQSNGCFLKWAGVCISRYNQRILKEIQSGQGFIVVLVYVENSRLWSEWQLCLNVLSLERG